ncbi:MAG: hypothetical protein H7X86_10140 [Gorillibacterium sp.]|nr:hypothetical protein [Gorillibacterium sp.]
MENRPSGVIVGETVAKAMVAAALYPHNQPPFMDKLDQQLEIHEGNTLFELAKKYDLNGRNSR